MALDAINLFLESSQIFQQISYELAVRTNIMKAISTLVLKTSFGD